jgi:threonine dehydratase
VSVTLQAVQAAAKRIASHVIPSPCPLSIPLSGATGLKVCCKLEYLQCTGRSRKRGATVMPAGANILQRPHDRMSASDDSTSVSVHCLVEARDLDDIAPGRESLRRKGFPVTEP